MDTYMCTPSRIPYLYPQQRPELLRSEAASRYPGGAPVRQRGQRCRFSLRTPGSALAPSLRDAEMLPGGCFTHNVSRKFISSPALLLDGCEVTAPPFPSPGSHALTICLGRRRRLKPSGSEKARAHTWCPPPRSPFPSPPPPLAASPAGLRSWADLGPRGFQPSRV